jgi:uncharacterized protein YegL
MSNSPSLVVSFVLDESGSMGSRSQATISGYNEYLQQLKKDNEGKKVLFSLTKFASRAHIVHSAELLDSIPELNVSTYIPGGSTALYDAVASTVLELEKRVDEDSKVLVIIMTDGEENASTDYHGAEGLEKVRSLLKSKTNEKNWAFIFLGADADAWSVGASLGATASIQYNVADMKGTMKKMSAGTKSYSDNVCRGVESAECLSSDFVKAYNEDTKNTNIVDKILGKKVRGIDMSNTSGIDSNLKGDSK